MKIWIRKGALDNDEETLLWPGALFGLKYLQKLGHEIGFPLDELNDVQQKLLENERIDSRVGGPGDAELIIAAGEGGRKNSLLVAGTNKGSNPVAEASEWGELAHKICFPGRKARHSRNTAETDIRIELNLDGTGRSKIDTGIGFLDHMLEQIAKHGLVDLEISCQGDLEVDEHHTIEDVAIALGEALVKALGNKAGIRRYSFVLPMDESQCRVTLDLSGRPYLVFDGSFERDKVGDFPTEMTEHFFYSLAMNLKATLHIEVEGSNDHHKIEACFKGFARCLRGAVSRSERQLNILPSTKEKL